MDKTININLAGLLFKIDEEAFPLLRDWLQAISNRLRNSPGGLETIEDIESRVAEILNQQKGEAEVISKANVEAMIAIIGKPEDFESIDENAPGFVPPPLKRRLYRSTDDIILSGVCGGLGANLNTDPVIFRILFVIAAFFGIGILIYLILWISILPAKSESQKRELYGSSYQSSRAPGYKSAGTGIEGSSAYDTGYYNSSRLGNVFNEMFRAVGKLAFVIMRIFLIFVGITFVLTGFLTILAFVMIFVMKMPWGFTHEGISLHFGYVHEFLNYIVTPSATPWIIFLTLLVIMLPMLALIYWGVKMIFWFRAKDGVVSLIGFVLWVLAVSALAMILLREGISFTQSGKSTVENIIKNVPDTLYIVAGRRCADIKSEKVFSIPDEEYSVYMDDNNHQMSISAELDVFQSEDNQAKIEILKRSSGRNRTEAASKAEMLGYNYTLGNDTLKLDEYFTIPSGRRWSADNIRVNLYVPARTILYFDSNTNNLVRRGRQIEYMAADSSTWSTHDINESWQLGNRYWKMSDNGLTEVQRNTLKHK